MEKGKEIRYMGLYESDSFTAAARELANYKLALVGIQDLRREKGGTVRAGD